MKKLFLIFLMLLCASWAWGVTYTVCGSGCDETTIQDIFDYNDLAPGDIIEVSAGTYREEVTWGSNDSGSDGSPVILQAKSGETVKISGADVFTGFSLSGGEYEKSGVTTEVKVLLRNGIRLERGTAGSLNANEWDWDSNTLYLKEDPSTYTIEGGQRSWGVYALNISYIKVKDITVYGCNNTGLYFRASTGDVDGADVDNVTSNYNRYYGIMHKGDNNSGYKVQNSEVRDSIASYNGVFGFAPSRWVYRIYFYDCTAAYNGWQNWGHGFTIGQNTIALTSGWVDEGSNDYSHDVGSYQVQKVYNTTDRTWLTKNAGGAGSLSNGEWDQSGTDVWIDIGETPNGKTIKYAYAYGEDIRWIDCISHDNEYTDFSEGHGFAFDGFCDSCQITRCISYNNSGSGFTANMPSGTSITNSLAYNNGGHGIRLQNDQTANTIYNNTSVGNTYDGIYLEAGVSNSTVKNNILTDNSDDGIDIDSSATNITHDYNLAYNNSGDDWADAASQQSHDVNADPLFKDSANGNYRLKASSPAKNAGTGVLTYGTTDLDGKLVTGSGASMGCYQFQQKGGFLWLKKKLFPSLKLAPASNSNCWAGD